MSLSSLIVRREVASMRQVEEALAQQVIYGGDLVTNLLEVARVDEAALTLVLAESMNLRPAPPGPLPLPSESLRAFVPVEWVLERGVFPLALEGESLVLAVAEPLSPHVQEALSASLGVRIEAYAALTVRILEATAQAYGTSLDARTVRLVGRLAGEPSLPRTSLPPAPSVEAGSTQAGSASTALSAAGSTAPKAGGSADATSSESSPPRTSQRAGQGSPVAGAGSMRPMPGRRATLTSFPSGRPPRPSTTPQPTRTASRPPPPPGPSSANAHAHRAALLQRSLMTTPRGGRRRRGPLTFEAARREADETSERDGLLALFFDYARQFFEYSALFLVQGDIAEGRDGFGAGASRERVLGIGIPLDLPSLVARARDARVPMVGVPPSDGLDASLLGDLQRPRHVEMTVVPLVVRTRVVALLLGDCGDAGIDREVLQQVTIFCGIVSKAFERIIVRRKLEGFVAVSRIDATKSPSVPPPAPTDAVRLPSVPPPAATDAARQPSPPPAPTDTVRLPSVRPPSPSGEAGQEAQQATEVPPPEAREGAAASAPDSNGASDNAWIDAATAPEFAVSVPPHRPPSAHALRDEALPSVIVDMDGELGELVDRVLAGGIDDQAEAELLLQGDRAVRVLMTRFPGTVTFDRTRIAAMPNPPRASQCGVLLRLVAQERKVAAPFVIARLADRDPETRGWAMHLLWELPYVEAIPGLLTGILDEDLSTRASAVLAIRAVTKASSTEALEAIERSARDPDAKVRLAAVHALGEVRDTGVVLQLIRGIGDPDRAVAAAARESLVRTTRQDFGFDEALWSRWHVHNGTRHRLEWLIDALTHEVGDVRRAAGDELRALSRQYFGYSSDLPQRDRERAQQRYRDWWVTEGRSRRRRS